MDTSAQQTSTTSDAEFDRFAAAAVASADTASTARIESLGLVHQARAARLARNLTNLTALHGAKSPIVVAAQAAHANAQTLVTRIELVHRQAIAVAPAVPAAGWAVWGHVYQAPAKPLSGYTVFLVDTQKAYQSQYGFATTAADGSFSIAFSGQSAHDSKDSSTPAPGTEHNAKGTIPSLLLSITNPDAQAVYMGSTPLGLVQGQALYIDTTLTAGEPRTELPVEIRKTAQPSKKTKKT